MSTYRPKPERVRQTVNIDGVGYLLADRYWDPERGDDAVVLARFGEYFDEIGPVEATTTPGQKRKRR